MNIVENKGNAERELPHVFVCEHTFSRFQQLVRQGGGEVKRTTPKEKYGEKT